VGQAGNGLEEFALRKVGHGLPEIVQYASLCSALPTGTPASTGNQPRRA
jgi:hypothetical protein